MFRFSTLAHTFLIVVDHSPHYLLISYRLFHLFNSFFVRFAAHLMNCFCLLLLVLHFQRSISNYQTCESVCIPCLPVSKRQ